MNDLEFNFNIDTYYVKAPFEDTYTADLFETNLNETFSSGASTPVCLPPGLVYVGDRQSLVIFERPPRYQKITYNPFNRHKAKNNDDKNQSFIVPLPWQIYVGEFGTNGLLNALHIYFSLSEIKGITLEGLNPFSSISFKFERENSLFCCPLPNVYETNLVCLDKETGYNENSNLASKINLMYSSMWDTCFNNDVIYQVDSQINYINSQNKKFVSRADRTLDFLNYWSSASLQQVLNFGKNGEDAFFNKHNIYMIDTIKLSEWFTAPSPYKFVNTLYKLI